MKKVALVVEGESDEVFWEKVLNKEFSGRCRFKVMKQHGRPNVALESGKLVEAFRGAKYDAVFFLVDLDSDPCFSAVKEIFPLSVRESAAEPLERRSIHICIARREFESWLLADEHAIRAALPNVQYSCTEPTDQHHSKGRLKRLIHEDRGAGAAFREPAFAREMAPHFSPQKAMPWSVSFAHFWTRISSIVEGGK